MTLSLSPPARERAAEREKGEGGMNPSPATPPGIRNGSYLANGQLYSANTGFVTPNAYSTYVHTLARSTSVCTHSGDRVLFFLRR